MNTPELPFSAACARNREPIVAVLRDTFGDRHEVLEIGSGTGQHAVYFAASLPWLHWQPTDRAAALPLQVQLRRQIVLAVHEGRLRPGLEGSG